MPLFRRRSGSAPAAPVDRDLPPGTLPCTERGCMSSEGLACFYIDRRQRACATAWCREHTGVVDGHPYCRRHAAVMRALPSADPATLPDVDNRAPGLLVWVAREVDDRVAALLEGMRGPGQQTTADPPHLAFIHLGRERVRAWERTWKLMDHTGILRWVSLDVEEENETELVVRINAVTVLRATPPWIDARRRGEVLPSDIDHAQRRRFYDGIVESVQQNLGARTA